jgi:hypothetical protein
VTSSCLLVAIVSFSNDQRVFVIFASPSGASGFLPRRVAIDSTNASPAIAVTGVLSGPLGPSGIINEFSGDAEAPFASAAVHIKSTGDPAERKRSCAVLMLTLVAESVERRIAGTSAPADAIGP